MNPTAQSQMLNRLFEAASQGDVKAVSVICSTMSSVDTKDGNGWTALMLAARNGHLNVVKHLLEKGCDRELMNNSGQTAFDIAKFWGYEPITALMEQGSLTQTHTAFDKAERHENFFGKTVLDRAAARRKDTEWLSSIKASESTVYVVFNKDLQVLVVACSENDTKPSFRLIQARYPSIKGKLEHQTHNPVFLGVQTNPEEQDSSTEGRAWFVVMVGDIEDGELKQLDSNAQWLQIFPDGLRLHPDDAGIFAQAHSILAWHDRYKFCPTCGKETSVGDAGYKRECSDESCRSRKGVHNTSYPRVDPTVILVVISPDGKSLLLGRGKRFPGGMYSCLAGFMEPGETIEAACRREVEEESGVKVGRVEYHSCQPWPMPASLMIGCIGYAITENIKVDKEELEDARWFSRQDITRMLNHSHPQGLFIPPDQAIAHVLIRTWVKMTSNL